MEWLVSVSDYIVELMPSWQTYPDGSKLEVKLDWVLILMMNSDFIQKGELMNHESMMFSNMVHSAGNDLQA